ncbi:MAG TPA: hypothetical protein VFB14_14135 [Bryobacteraceae bacterium]|jgi:hypothetical protein|nr:hypothetical protein [Bryobacteraceae bacterium]
MLIIPFQLPNDASRGPVVVVMILEKENLDRMKEADPFDVHFSRYAGHMAVDRPIRQLDFVIAYEEDTNRLLEFKAKDDLAGLMKWLQRGRKIEAGDLHAPFPLRKN